LLREVRLFDVYQGNKIDSGRKSLALGLILQASSQTLTDKDVDETIGRVLERLELELGATLRD
jgi:phenylalanyl-tRNA synthetase beta chain